MTADILWRVVETGRLVVAFGLPLLLLVAIRRPHSWLWRVPLVVLTSWVALMLYTSEAYFRVGIARAMQQGVDNPYHGFDNNNFVPVLVLSWLAPAAICGIAAIARWAFQKHRGGKRATVA